MREIDELRPLTAGRLLELWQACREAGDPLERVLLCNGRILSECCFAQGKRVYGDEAEALADLTGRQMERLLRRLAEGGTARFVLAHLSQENNSPAMALRAVETALRAAGLSPRLSAAPRDRLSGAYVLEGGAVCSG